MYGSREQATWDLTVDGITPPGNGYDPGMVRSNIYNPAGPEAENLKNLALEHAQEYMQRTEIGYFAWAKTLKLVDREVPAGDVDKEKMENGRTWQH